MKKNFFIYFNNTSQLSWVYLVKIVRCYFKSRKLITMMTKKAFHSLACRYILTFVYWWPPDWLWKVFNLLHITRDDNFFFYWHSLRTWHIQPWCIFEVEIIRRFRMFMFTLFVYARSASVTWYYINIHNWMSLWNKYRGN